MKHRVHKVGGTLAGLGLLLLMGTVGSCEMNHIGIGQTVIQALSGLAMMKVGVDLLNKKVKETNR